MRQYLMGRVYTDNLAEARELVKAKHGVDGKDGKVWFTHVPGWFEYSICCEVENENARPNNNLQT